VVGEFGAEPATVFTKAVQPGAPTGVAATGGDASAAVSWTAPASDGGSPIIGYTVTATDATTPAHGGQTATVGTGDTSATVTGLTNGDSYTFTVTATNGGDSDASAASAAVIPATVPEAPTGVAALGGVASAAVSWSAPAVDGGSAITGYIVTATDSTTPGNGGQTKTVSGTSATITGLTNGDRYTFSVVARNAKGSSVSSASSGVVVPAPSAKPTAQLANTGSTLPGWPTLTGILAITALGAGFMIFAGRRRRSHQ
jgi:LPXTG-motif cell wall-anchored protein